MAHDKAWHAAATTLAVLAAAIAGRWSATCSYSIANSELDHHGDTREPKPGFALPAVTLVVLLLCVAWIALHSSFRDVQRQQRQSLDDGMSICSSVDANEVSSYIGRAKHSSNSNGIEFNKACMERSNTLQSRGSTVNYSAEEKKQAITEPNNRPKEPKQRRLSNLERALQHTPTFVTRVSDSQPGLARMVESCSQLPDLDGLFASNASISVEKGQKPARTIKIVSVDDQPINQDVIRALLTGTGYEVVELGTGEELLSYVDSCCILPDAILLDVTLPGLDGCQVTRILRKRWTSAELPIIMITCLSKESVVVEGLESGANDFMTKPIRYAELRARIHTQLALKRGLQVALEACQNLALLRSILPANIIAQLKAGGQLVPEMHPQVTVLFSDIKGFTNMAASWPTERIITMLNTMFTAFDSLCEQLGVFKVETIGDAYMIVSGHDGTADHASRMMHMACGMLTAVQGMQSYDGGPLQIRVGVHTGPAHSGVVGMTRPRFCFFGDTINVASRMETTGFPMAVHVSDATYNAVMAYQQQHVPESDGNMLLQTTDSIHTHAAAPLVQSNFEFLPCGARDIKGKGKMHTHILKFGEWQQALQSLKDSHRKQRPDAVPDNGNSMDWLINAQRQGSGSLAKPALTPQRSLKFGNRSDRHSNSIHLDSIPSSVHYHQRGTDHSCNSMHTYKRSSIDMLPSKLSRNSHEMAAQGIITIGEGEESPGGRQGRRKPKKSVSILMPQAATPSRASIESQYLDASLDQLPCWEPPELYPNVTPSKSVSRRATDTMPTSFQSRRFSTSVEQSLHALAALGSPPRHTGDGNALSSMQGGSGRTYSSEEPLPYVNISPTLGMGSRHESRLGSQISHSSSDKNSTDLPGPSCNEMSEGWTGHKTAPLTKIKLRSSNGLVEAATASRAWAHSSSGVEDMHNSPRVEVELLALWDAYMKAEGQGSAATSRSAQQLLQQQAVGPCTLARSQTLPTKKSHEDM